MFDIFFTLNSHSSNFRCSEEYNEIHKSCYENYIFDKMDPFSYSKTILPPLSTKLEGGSGSVVYS